MNSVQRQFGKLTHRGGGDDAKVSVLLQDYENGDKMLAKVSSHPTIQSKCANGNRSLMLQERGEMPGCLYSPYNSIW